MPTFYISPISILEVNCIVDRMLSWCTSNWRASVKNSPGNELLVFCQILMARKGLGLINKCFTIISCFLAGLETISPAWHNGLVLSRRISQRLDSQCRPTVLNRNTNARSIHHMILSSNQMSATTPIQKP